MSAAHTNECPVAAGQIVKTQSKSSRYFIAVCAMIGSPTGGMVAAMAVILVQVVLNMPDVFAGLDWAGLLALGGITRTPEQIPMFEDPSFCPMMPPKNSAAEQALNDLLARDLTQIDWLESGNGWRLAAAVKSLDYLGWEPISIRVKCNGWGRKIARYSLPAKAKQAAAAMRQKGGEHA